MQTYMCTNLYETKNKLQKHVLLSYIYLYFSIQLRSLKGVEAFTFTFCFFLKNNRSKKYQK